MGPSTLLTTIYSCQYIILRSLVPHLHATCSNNKSSTSQRPHKRCHDHTAGEDAMCGCPCSNQRRFVFLYSSHNPGDALWWTRCEARGFLVLGAPYEEWKQDRHDESDDGERYQCCRTDTADSASQIMRRFDFRRSV